jgi:HAD superfamily hydrolase (TIGR01484 family)
MPEPLQRMPLWPRIEILWFDIDDTFTSGGLISADAFSALEAWRNSSRIAIAVTGRPAGWCDHIARMWPIDAVIGENGGFWFAYDRDSRKMERISMQSDEEKEKSLRIFPELTVLIQQRFPQSRIAADQEYRICDLAIDFAEDVGPLPLREAHEIAALMQSFGMSAKVSSIHVNGWFGQYDKLSTTLSLATRRLGLSGETLNQSSIYIGDSPNDSPLFRFFDRSIGVSNVNQYGDLLEALPKYICAQPSARGFAEAVRFVLQGADP